MKTNHIALTLLASAALMLSACVNETDFKETKYDEKDMAFKISTVKTRANAEADEYQTVKIGSFKSNNGELLVLEESVESLDGGMATRGTPAFTENVFDLYTTFNAVAPYDTDGKTSLPDASYAFDGTTWWTHHYGGLGELFPAKYQFFMRMPGDIANGKYGLTSAPTYNANGSIEFNYKSPATASEQKDILFTSKTVESNGESIYFYHVLTGVKFQNFYTNKNPKDNTTAVAKTTITGVSIKGIKNSGHCTVTPGSTSEGASATVSQWTDVTGKANFTQAFTDTTNYKDSSYGLDTLLNTTAGARNLNDKDGSLTFWFVPQTIAAADSVKITVKFDVDIVQGSTSTKTHSGDSLTVLLGAREWKAGELHTFTLKPTAVGVEIDDDMTEYVKSDVVVKNTGNVYEYVRVNMIANWVGNVQTAEGVYDWADTTILMGFALEHPDSMRMVEPWNDKDGKTKYGVFEELTPQSKTIPATVDSTVNNWVRYDKYYYYIKPIGPDDSITDDLFKTYTVGVSPDYWIVDKWGTRRKATNVHLVMDLMVQAIPAPVDKDGNVLDNTDNEGYIRAWLEALGFEPTEANYSKLLDL